MTADRRPQTADRRPQTADRRIIVFFKGQLGNQLFQYAFARSLQIKFYPHYTINFNCSSTLLKDFNVNLYREINVSFNECITFLQSLAQSFHSRFTRLILKCPVSIRTWLDANVTQRIINIFGLYEPLLSSCYEKPHKSWSRNIICSGYFEAYKYFDSIRNTIIDELSPVHDILPHNADLFADIHDSESVCVHIRRGDFMRPENKHCNVCNEQYFITAMKQIRKEIPDCKFFIFSDDIDEVKRTMNFPFEAVYERGDNPTWETLRLMYNCKHFIISNSTFGWWAQYLSRNENKIVYAPVPWRWGEDRSGVYMPNMRTIECHRH